MLRIILITLFVYFDRKSLTVVAKLECGYKQCPQTRDGALNVHLIPHSHMDAGWVKTFDEYYYGTRTTVSTANVQLIFHSVLSELLHDSRRRFTFSETGYFWKWWKQQRPSTRSTVRSLVQEGRIEFAGGGWVQNDEATADYSQIIDQYTWGLRKLNDTLGPCGKPKAAWQIDTYGHTKEQASLLAQMGYDGLFIGRVDHKEREVMIEEDRMEFMWRGSEVLGKMSDIMTHTLFNLYNAPEGFCFDFLCSDEPIVDDPDNKEYNAVKRVNDFITQIERQAKYYDHDNIIVTMGGDFTYQSAANWYMNMDKLINHVNTHPGNITDVNIFYSTPSCYLKAIYLYGRRDKAIYTERGDHLPYGSDSNTYWTGFYTSRPSLKYLIRRAHTFLQVVKQLTVLARVGDSYELHLLRHAVNLLLHHDAITGTSQQHVTNDFIRILSDAVEACTKKVSVLLSYLTPTWGGSRRPAKNVQQFIVCHELNMSQCRFTETQQTMILLVYNPLSVKTYHHIRLPAIALHYSIRDFNDEEVEYQVVPLPAATINLPGRSSTAIQELCFEAENIPPLGYTAFYISPIRDPLAENEFANKAKNTPIPEPDQEVITNIFNEYLRVSVNKDTGLLESIQHVDGVKIMVKQNFYYYSQSQQAFQSGAYSFRPDGKRPTPVTERVTYHAVRGTLVKEIRQRFADWISQVIRLYRGEEFVEIEWVVGPVPIGSDLGKEVVTIFSTNITNNGEFFTDSNGRQMMKRTCWNESTSQQKKRPVAACYYPVTNRICISSLNTSVEMCVLTDRAQGGTSYHEGEMELMVHRRLLTDDGFGLEEPLNEEAYGVGLVIKGKHRIIFGNNKQELDGLTFSERAAQSARRWQNEPWLFFTPGEKISRRKWLNVRNKRYSALRINEFPRHLHILTLEPWKAGSVLLRLENTLEKSPRGSLSKLDAEDYSSKSSHITVQLRRLFLQHRVVLVRETTLAANQWLDDARQMDWSTRYVYNGADDGILQEDNIDYESVKYGKHSDRESEHVSEEDTHTRIKKINARIIEKSRSKLKHEHERKKRTVNMTNNAENVINGSYENQISKIGNESIEAKLEDTTIQPTNIFTFINDFKVTKVTQKSPKLSQTTSWVKPAEFLRHFDDTGEIEESEEDFSSNLKKRDSKRRRKNKKTSLPEPPKEDVDDGITRSIYEMYYKQQTRRSYKISNPDSIQPQRSLENSELIDPKVSVRMNVEIKKRVEGKRSGLRRRVKVYNEDYSERYVKRNGYFKRRLRESESEEMSRNTSRRKTLKADLPFLIGGNRSFGRDKTQANFMHDYLYEGEGTEDQKHSSYDREDIGGRNRNKRSPFNSQDPADQSDQDPDYIVTLRPTQIRTFIVWFEKRPPLL